MGTIHTIGLIIINSNKNNDQDHRSASLSQEADFHNGSI